MNQVVIPIQKVEMKRFFLKKRDEALVAKLDPVTALEERLKSIETIVDPAERLLELSIFSNDCEKVSRSFIAPGMSMKKAAIASALVGITIGGGVCLFGGMVLAAGVTFGVASSLGTMAGLAQIEIDKMDEPYPETPELCRLRNIKDSADLLQKKLIASEDLKKLVESPYFEQAAMKFPQLKERFELAAKKTAFIEQNKAKPLPHPQKPDNRFRL